MHSPRPDLGPRQLHHGVTMTNHRRRMLILPILAIFAAAGCGGGTKEITDRRGCNPSNVTTNNCVEVMR